MSDWMYLKESLLGTRSYQGEFIVKGYDDDDYQALYDYLLDTLAGLTHNFQGNFYLWYRKQVKNYHHRKLLKNHTYDFSDPIYETEQEFHSIRMQLTIFKFYIFKRAHNPYA